MHSDTTLLCSVQPGCLKSPPAPDDAFFLIKFSDKEEN